MRPEIGSISIPWICLKSCIADAFVTGYYGRMEERPSAEYIATLRKLSGPQKLRTAAALYWGARKLKAARLREQHPDWTDDQVERRVKEIFLYAVT